MPATTPLHVDTCLARNLAAMRARQPGLADVLIEAMPPTGAVLTVGRDGCPLAVLPHEDGAVGWLGGSSAPSVSIPARLGSWEDRGGNVAVPSIGSGYEGLYLTSLLGAHRAVFVCEPDPARVALALAAVDLAAVLEAGRLVLLVGDIAMAAAGFFRANPGYQYPVQIVGMNAGDADALAACKTALDHASGIVEAQLQGVIADTLGGYRAKPVGSRVERLLILSTDLVGGAQAFTRELVRAAETAGLAVETMVAERPDLGTAVPYVQALVGFRPDLVLFMNSTPATFGSTWPSDQPSASWFLESDHLPANSLAGLAGVDRLFAASSRVADLLARHGADRDQITILERGVDATCFGTCADSPGAPEGASGVAADGALLLMGDLHDLRTEAVQIRLDSHERLWQVACQLAADLFARGGDLNANDVLEQAERATGVVIEDASLRAQMFELVANPLIPSVAARGAAAALGDLSGLAILGRGWQADARWRPSWRGPVPAGVARRDAYGGASVVVLPGHSAEDALWALEALACDRLPVLRRHATGWHGNYPRAASVLAALPAFGSPVELKEIVARAQDTDMRLGWIGPLREQVLGGLTVGDSLARLIGEVISG